MFVCVCLNVFSVYITCDWTHEPGKHAVKRDMLAVMRFFTKAGSSQLAFPLL